MKLPDEFRESAGTWEFGELWKHELGHTFAVPEEQLVVAGSENAELQWLGNVPGMIRTWRETASVEVRGNQYLIRLIEHNKDHLRFGLPEGATEGTPEDVSVRYGVAVYAFKDN